METELSKRAAASRANGRKGGRPAAGSEPRNALLQVRVRPTVKAWISQQPGTTGDVIDRLVTEAMSQESRGGGI